ncbi:MAG: DNA mismatch repair endonuclease MutL [Chloroflexaceae bacterium]|nr:DNA mismatch repair endonuclease MutL [Chloroflexaceae bacterium]
MGIRVLETTVAAQIAAGEVIERPASVVKELMENALDAGAQRIAVEVSGGGLREIKVQDDGCGIVSDQLELAFERHATSKLTDVADLWSINTLGFRGEALPSIASVAQVLCISRASNEEVGCEIRIAGGELQACLPRGCPSGTTIHVRNLFYNTPVRREYLRSAATEMSAVTTIVQQYALAYPEVRFTLLLDGRLALQTNGNGSLRDVLIEVYGLDTARQMLPVEMHTGEDTDSITIVGMVSPPGVTRSSRSGIHLFINRRAILVRGAVAAVIGDAYHTLLMKGRHPLVVLDIRLHPAMVDVNVHPNKGEVRFRQQSRLMSAIARAIREALVNSTDETTGNTTDPAPGEVPRRFEVRPPDSATRRNEQEPATGTWRVSPNTWRADHQRWDVGRGQAPDASQSSSRASAEQMPLSAPANGSDNHPMISADETATLTPGPSPKEGEGSLHALPATAAPAEASRSKLPPLRVVGQVGLTYIVAESPHGLYLVDQHAAHERITYEQLMQQHRSGMIESQQLLMSQSVQLEPDAVELLLGHQEQLQNWGFALERWGEGGVLLRTIPATLHLDALPQAIQEIVAYLREQSGSTPLDWHEAMLTTLSCHHSVRAGQELSLDEMRELLIRLERCESPRTCPHGRPTMVLLTPGQLERQFGRIT